MSSNDLDITLMTDSQHKDKAHARLADAPKPGEVWRHYKGGLYAIICSAIREDTLELMVVYHSNKTGHDQVRTLANWNESVRWEWGAVRNAPRFVRVKE
jgi:hypothetical protein